MATLLPSPVQSRPTYHRRRKSWARRVERFCCTTLSYFPLTFVFGLSTWAIWVEVNVSLLDSNAWSSTCKLVMGVLLYSLAMISYSVAVFTSPGSPLEPRRDRSGSAHSQHRGGAYVGIPTSEHGHDDTSTQARNGPMTIVTAKSTGEPRYCKKCQCLKPDRAHHCSTCKRCVLKMDHHCPWLATCVGLYNYKPFLLFLIYISLFCCLSFFVTARWVWLALVENVHFEEGLRVVNIIMLAVLSGVIGLVLSGFTGWHIYLTVTGQTTIESLEKTRYLSPLRKKLEPQPQQSYIGDDGPEPSQEQGLLGQFMEAHANALPGVLRPEEGEESRSSSPLPPRFPLGSHIQLTNSPARASLQRNYASLEAQREHERYSSYLDERDSEKMPNAFDLGWRSNLIHVFGDRLWLWALPVCNTSGDGWMWPISPEWISARADLSKEREAREREEAAWRQERSEWQTRSRQPPPPPPSAQDPRRLPGTPARYDTSFMNAKAMQSTMQMQPLDRRKGGRMSPADDIGTESGDMYDTSSDEERTSRHNNGFQRVNEGATATANWNDVPDDFLASGTRHGKARSSSRSRRKGD